jgi:hypothetical protein
MFSWLVRRRIQAFEKSFDYDASYLHEMAKLNRNALYALQRATGLGAVRGDVPTDVFYAAKLTVALHEDCGPCVQLVANMATQAGVAPQSVAAVLQGDWAKLPETVALSAQFARATLERTPELDALRDALELKVGRAGLMSLALAIAAARIYPGIKYALGYGQHCQRVTVGGRAVTPTPSPSARLELTAT